MPALAMGLGGAASLAGSLISNSTANNAQEAAAAATQKAVDAINAVGASPDLAKQIFLEQFKSAGILTPEVEQNINAHFQQIAAPNANVTNAQNDVLSKLTQQSASGLTPQDRLALAQIQTQTARNNQASQNSITQNLAARGLTGAGTSGAEIAERLMAQQQGAQNENMQGLQVGANSAQAALQALSAEGGQANAMNSQQFQQNQANAGIANEQNRFNTQNQIAAQNRNVNAQNQAHQYNLSNAQQLANANTSQANQEQQREVQAQQQMYQNAMQHAQGVANAYTGQGQQLANAGRDKAGAQAGLFGGLASTAAGVGNYLTNQSNYNTLMGVLGNKNNPLETSNTVNGVDGSASNGMMYAYEGGIVNPTNTIPAGYNSGGNVEGEYNAGGSVRDFRQGGVVPGKAKVPGNSPVNDTVPAMLSPGEFVLSREDIAKMKEKEAPKGPKELDYGYLKSLLDTHKNAHKSMKKMCDGGMSGYDQGGPVSPEQANIFAQGLNQALGQPAPSPSPVQMLGYNGGNTQPAQQRDLKHVSPQEYADGGYVPNEMDYGSSQPVGAPPVQINPLPQDVQSPSLEQLLAQYKQTQEDTSHPESNPQLPPSTGDQGVLSTLKNAEQRIPTAEAPQKELAAKDEADTDSDESEKPSVMPVKAAEQPASEQKPSTDYLGAMKAAMGASNTNSLNANLLKAYQQALGAGGRRAPDYSLADSLEKSANAPVEQLGQGIKVQDMAQKMELNKEMDDPNSKISKLMQGIAVKYGVDPKVAEGASASSLQKLVPTLATAASREDVAKLRNAMMGSKAEHTDNKELNGFITKARSEGLKQQQASDELNKSVNILQEGIKNPNSINDIASFYASAKAFNPKAIVRSQSVKLEQQAMGPWKNLENKINALAGGQVRLSDTGVQQSMLDSINQLKAIADKDKQQYREAVIQQGKKGYKLPDDRVNEIFPDYQPTPEGQQVSDVVNKTAAAPGAQTGMVKVKSPQGDVHLIPKEAVDMALKNGGQLVQ